MRALALGREDERIWADEGKDHVGSARAAYGDGHIYRRLLRHVRQRTAPGGVSAER